MFKYSWAIFAIALVSYCSIGSPLLVMSSSIIGIIFVVGVAFGWKHSNLFGAILAVLFGLLSYEAGYYGNATINLLCVLPASLYGWWLWIQRTNQSNLKRSLNTRQLALISLVGVALFIVASIGSFTSGANLPIHDALTTVLPLLATFLLVNAYREQWYLWILYNALEVFMWYHAFMINPDVLAVFIMRIVFTVNSIIGWYEWNRK